MKIVVIGVGNSLFSDDGVGLKLVGLFDGFVNQKQINQDSFFNGCEVKTIVSEAIDPFIASKCKGFDRVIIVDAALIDKSLGHCAVFNSQDLEDNVFLRNTHNFSALDLARMVEKQLMVKNVELFCIRPKKLEFGESLSNELESRMPKLLEELILCVFKQNK